MSSYGPPGGPYPGQPQDPWGDAPTDDYASGYPDPLTEAGLGQRPTAGSTPAGQPGHGGPEGQPGHAGPGGQPGHAGPAGPTGFGHGAYGPRPNPAPGSVTGEVWGPPRPPLPGGGRSGRSGNAIGVIIVVVVLALAGAGAAAYVLTRDGEREPTGNPSAGTGASGSADPSATVPSASAPNADAKVAKTGDCLVNRGTTESPDMQKVDCAASTYQVLKRIDGTADKDKCQGTPGLTDWYFFDHSDDKQDFVLCLKKR